ncbi:SMP-30/gluconolactonase/LRE family protein [Gordonia sp. CPCC 205515]|uniref:SMP-30/gluconolactonase/LRE family protein n=1 Tax=Gordonia sp. CPCC 205515 TaxID=3140791 RepID=UPI003AF34C20
MQKLIGGLGLLESPRWHDGRLWFADWTAGQIRVLADDRRSSRVVVEHESLPLCFDFAPNGTLLVVSAATQSLLRFDGEQLIRFADLTPLSTMGANDIVVDGRGNAYVNSPNAPFGSTSPPDEPAPGRIALITPDGAVTVVADDLDFPNGMAVTADNATLIVAESYRQRLSAFDIRDDGTLGERRVFAELREDPPDGITVDADGAVWYADVPHGQCVRVAEGGDVQQRVTVDRGAFACILGGAPRDPELFIVGAQWPGASGLSDDTDWDGAVWSVPVDRPGSGWPGN